MSQLGDGGIKVSVEQYTNGRLDFVVRQIEDMNAILIGISPRRRVTNPVYLGKRG
jgi:hypothetical protein